MGFIKLRSGRLVEALQKKAAELRGRKACAAIRVPDELSWWYYQEVGTGPHPIPLEPRTGGAGSPLLMLPPDGEHGLFFSQVHHPGSAGKHYIQRIEPDIIAMAQRRLVQALVDSDFDVNTVQQILLTEVMPEVVNMIATSMGEALGFSREGGKLEGEPPELVYRGGAEIVDLSVVS